jgi:hypothetical protein
MKASSYLIGNILRLRCKDQLLNAVIMGTADVSCENHMRHINTLCAQNVVCCCVKTGSTCRKL